MKKINLLLLIFISARISAQNVGIGTTTPGTKLTINTTGYGLEHTDGTMSIKTYIGGSLAQIGTYSNHPFQLMANNGTNQFVLLPAGQVGIGTAAPAGMLEVSGNAIVDSTVKSVTATNRNGFIHTDGTVFLETYVGTPSTGGGPGGWIGTKTPHPLFFYTGNNNPQMTLTTGGIFGIGNNIPANGGLVVDTKIGAVNAMFGSNTTGISIESSNPGIGFNSYYGVAGRKYIQSGYGGVIGFDPAAGSFVFGATAGTGSAGASATIPALMTILPNGNVGIGNTSPSTRLRINTATNAYGFTQTDGTATIGTFVGTPSGGTLGGWIGTQTNHPLYFCTAGVMQMDLSTDGSLGIANTLGVSNTHNVAGTNYGIDVSVAGAGSNKTGIYTEAYGPNSIGLSAYGDTYAVYGNGTTWSGYFIGSVFATTYQTSDEKLKTNIAAYPDALTAIAALPVKMYDYLHDGVYKTMRLPQGRQVGIMAQDIEKQFPQLVKQTVNQVPDEKTHRPSEQTIEFKAVNYTGLIPVLVKGMQEQQQQIEVQNKKIDDLEKELTELKNLIKHS